MHPNPAFVHSDQSLPIAITFQVASIHCSACEQFLSLVGNLGLLGQKLNLPLYLDYNCNTFNDYNLDYYSKFGSTPIISPELSIEELKSFKNKDFIFFCHGKIRLMTLAHDLKEKKINYLNPIYLNFILDYMKNRIHIDAYNFFFSKKTPIIIEDIIFP